MVIKHQNNHIIHEITFTSVRCNNVMWVGASDAVLFDSVQDGKVQGLRPEVLTPLIHMYLNPPRYSTKQKNHDILSHSNQTVKTGSELDRNCCKLNRKWYLEDKLSTFSTK